jgi:hypothetical protein
MVEVNDSGDRECKTRLASPVLGPCVPTTLHTSWQALVWATPREPMDTAEAVHRARMLRLWAAAANHPVHVSMHDGCALTVSTR